MENLIIAIFVYVLFIAIAYAPKSCKVVSLATKIDYFPDVPNVELTKPEPIKPIETAITVTEPEKVTEPIETAIAVIPAKNALINPVNDLTRLTIRELKKLASGRIKNYSNLTKKELVLALS
jgi:hypothetical protein